MSREVNDGILDGFAHGLLTSASLLANGPDAAYALHAWRTRLVPQSDGQLPSRSARRRLGDADRPFDLGVHLNLTQGRPLTDRFPDELLDDRGRFPGVAVLFRRLRSPRPRLRAGLFAELSAQVEVMLDHGVPPTHLNGHQYVELIPGVAAILPALLQRYAIRTVRVAREARLWRTTLWAGRPAAWCLAQVKQHYARRWSRIAERLHLDYPDRFFGTAHAGRVDLGRLRQFLAASRGCRVVEIGLHPARSGPHPGTLSPASAWWDPLAKSRPHERQLLLSSDLADWLVSHGFQLGRLADLRSPDGASQAAA